MRKSRIFLFLCILSSVLSVNAQEVVMPSGNNRIRKQSDLPIRKPMSKSAASLPLIDYFVVDGKPSLFYWNESSCSVKSRRVIFNAIDSSGAAYSSPGATDILISKGYDLSTAYGSLFVSFSFQNGNTWQGDDSLVLSAMNVFGEWETIWQSGAGSVNWKEVYLNLDLTRFGTALFALKFTSFSGNNSLTNSETFLISRFVLAKKIETPWYETLGYPSGSDTLMPVNSFAGPDVEILDGPSNAFIWGNFGKLDMADSSGNIYESGNASYGGGDTLYMHPLDILSHPVSDSLFLSFACKPGAGNQPLDSFIVEFRNNLGVWVKVLAMPGNAPSNLLSYTFNVNYSRFRHSFFQARFYIKSGRTAGNTANWLVSGFRFVRRIDIPFIDDFSNSRLVTSSDRWQDDYVYINNDFPVNHPSINVATFDGLDQYGNPYSKFALKGICDKLTSNSINLSGLTPADSVILSFYYQYEPQGTTEQVYPDDSLELEFKSSVFSGDSFVNIKLISANDSLLYKFTYYSVAITDSRFLHDDFQFRIKNRGSQTGNLSQWHVDYIRFNKGRKLNDGIKDIALTNSPHIYLGPYSSMPWSHYQANAGAYSNKQDSLVMVNHDDIPYAIDYFRSVIRPEGDTLDKYVNILGSILPRKDTTVYINKNFIFNSGVSADSLVFQTRYRLKISGTAIDNVSSNDTITVPVLFSNFFAYDDGTAEGGYGIKNKTNVGACLKYKVEVPDSIYGVYIFFNQSEKDVSTQHFNLKIWKSISPLFEPANSDVVLYSREITKPLYTNTINGFASIRLDQPVAVTDSFFIGWDQTSSFVLNVGLDKNYPYGVNPNMYYKMDGRWYPSEIPGGLMIRPIIGKFLGSATGVTEPDSEEKAAQIIQVYPNPASNRVYFQLPDGIQFEVSITGLDGKVIRNADSASGNLDISGITDGFYLLVFENSKDGQKFARKLIIKH